MVFIIEYIKLLLVPVLIVVYTTLLALDKKENVFYSFMS